MLKTKYVLNRRSKILHRLPSQEFCNADQIPRPFKKSVTPNGTTWQRWELKILKATLCRHCFKT